MSAAGPCRRCSSGSNTSPSTASPRWPNLRRANGREEPWRLPYFGVGNENWGCGGYMRPEYYADHYRRYQTYVRHFGGNRVFKIACGANRDDYDGPRC